MNEDVEKLLNKPKEFKIGDKTVYVEAQPPGAVTLIIKKLIEKAKVVDLEILKQMTDEADVDSIYALFEKRLDEAAGKDFEIFQMMLTPAEVWKEKRASVGENDYPVSKDDLEWNATELMLSEIFDEWMARNPRFEIQKKMINLTAK